MRLAAMTCALAIGGGVGAFLWQGPSVPRSGPISLAQKVAPAEVGRTVLPPSEEQGFPSGKTPSAKLAAASNLMPNDLIALAHGAVAVPTAPPISVQSQAPSAAVRAGSPCRGNPEALGISRVVEIDTTGGPGFGFEQFKTHDFLQEGEVVLTFDDGPWPKNTQSVLTALAFHCTKAIFFPIGLHATYEPSILKQVAAAGHAIGSHTWCHQDLSKTRGRCQMNGKLETTEYDPKDEIEKGISAVRLAAGVPTAPYFRFPGLRQSPELVEYLGKRNIAIFSTDMDFFDFKMRKPEQVRQSVMAKLKKHGKGIVLMHDFQHATGEAIGGLLQDLKAGGYRVVFMKSKFPVTTIPAYDDMILKQIKTAGTDGSLTSSVVRTITE